MLIKKHGGLLANLNEALGLERTHSQLARIKNRNMRKDRPGKFFEMGDDQARTIEEKLGLPVGWMDTPPSYAEIFGEDHPITSTLRAMERLPTYLQESAASLILGLTKSHENHFVQLNANVVATNAPLLESPQPTNSRANKKLVFDKRAKTVTLKKEANKRAAFSQFKNMPKKSTVFVNGKAVVLKDFNKMVDNSSTSDVAQQRPITTDAPIRVEYNTSPATKTPHTQ